MCYCMTFCTCIHCRLLSWNLELEWEIGYEKVADLRAEVRCRYGAGTAPIAAKTDFIRTLNGPLTVHVLRDRLKVFPQRRETSTVRKIWWPLR